LFGVSPRPDTILPFSSSEAAFARAFVPWSAARFSTARTHLALYHGHLPIRPRASTHGVDPDRVVLRYARHVRSPAPTLIASVWQYASAPARPPRSPPLPGFTLVMKKLIFAPDSVVTTHDDGVCVDGIVADLFGHPVQAVSARSITHQKIGRESFIGIYIEDKFW
jgi:hypothetical protein